MSTIDPLGLLERWFWVVADTEMDQFRDCVRLGGDPTGTATLGVSPFGLVEECIGDLASIMNFEPTKAALINTDFEGVAKGSFAGANGHSR